MSAKDEIEKLALKVAEAANADGVKLEQRMEALNILYKFYNVYSKNKHPEDESAEGGEDFGAFRRALDEAQEVASGGAAQVRSRRGSRPS